MRRIVRKKEIVAHAHTLTLCCCDGGASSLLPPTRYSSSCVCRTPLTASAADKILLLTSARPVLEKLDVRLFEQNQIENSTQEVTGYKERIIQLQQMCS